MKSNVKIILVTSIITLIVSTTVHSLEHSISLPKFGVILGTLLIAAFGGYGIMEWYEGRRSK